ncbi:class I SAM-dependent methyltransferase [Streptomyces sp. LP05-1]|uniref:Class I SAM-dependent methyltransferase n=1 Tax=Streptomyces pyxinae TaxID=2970734 RepID=A0ABT2CKB5_9ACTN|nr:class I SAM-dependent methyltransferase [Streptomyces sp. LP05-1]MCS0637857.1 class I SAM-dependent methyltransferase [Streptomyces sp. LP05-1]
MPSLLSNRLAKRVLKPAMAMVEQRLQRESAAFQADLDALHHQVADLRRRSYGLGLLLDQTGRDGHRMPTETQMDTLVREVGTLTGCDDHRVRDELTVAYRQLVALEALGVGGLAGTLSDVCGRLAALSLLDPPGGEVLAVDGGSGLFAVALGRMLRRAGADARLTVLGPAARAEAVRANLALCGGHAPEGEARFVAGAPGDPEARTRLADRRYGILLADGPGLPDLSALAAPGALLVTPANTPAPGFRLLGRVAASDYHRAPR